MIDTICFVTRDYGGIHIGKHRFDIIHKLVDEVIINISAQANNKGVRPYRVNPPAMVLPHPSAHQLWTTVRPTLQGYRRSGTSTHTDATDGEPRSNHGESDKPVTDNDMDITITPGNQPQATQVNTHPHAALPVVTLKLLPIHQEPQILNGQTQHDAAAAATPVATVGAGDAPPIATAGAGAGAVAAGHGTGVADQQVTSDNQPQSDQGKSDNEQPTKAAANKD
jgi:hypothetical protein